MKPYLSLIITFLLSVTASAQEFCIRGNLKGLKRGISVSILPQEDPLDADYAKRNAQADEMESGDLSNYVHVDRTIAKTTVTEDGILEIRGHIDRPQLVTLITTNIDMVEKDGANLPDSERYKAIHWSYTPVFLDNADYVIGAPAYDLLTNEPITDQCVITGGEAQTDFNTFNLMLQKAKQPDAPYLKPEERAKVGWEFIKSHPTSVVSVYLADEMLSNGYNLTSAQIQQLQAGITACPIDTLRYQKFKRKLQIASHTAAGNPVVDLSLLSPDNAPAQLVDIIPQGKIVLIDFWASWCGICRAGTPRIKELYAQYPRSQFEVISISCDTSSDRWRTAMQKDDMPWAQYLLTKQGYQDFFARYQASGVPYLLLVDAEGKVIANPGSPEAVAEYLQQHLQ